MGISEDEPEEGRKERMENFGPKSWIGISESDDRACHHWPFLNLLHSLPSVWNTLSDWG